MSDKFIRVYKKLDVNEIKRHLMIYGDISANCGNCNAFNIKMDMATCPECKTDFKYISFRNIAVHIPKVHRLMEEKPSMLIVDHEDFKKSLGVFKAEEFLIPHPKPITGEISGKKEPPVQL